MRSARITILLLAGFSALPAAGEQARPELSVSQCDAVLEFGAQAYARDTAQPIYREVHRQCIRDDRPVWGEMRYFDNQDREFAYKWLDYTVGVATPDFQLEDLRNDYLEGARREGARVVLRRGKRAPGRIQTTTVKPAANAVIDSGFDEFLRANLPRLLRGETVRLQFLVAGELDSFSFKAHGLERVRLYGRDAYHVRVEHDSFLVRMLVDPILLWYDADSMRLLEYQGISNIKDAQGARYDARIVYPPDQLRRVIPGREAEVQ